MLFTIRNLGPIEEFTFDTDKDLYLIVGENSVGKSYACEVLYVFLKALSSDYIQQLYKPKVLSPKQPWVWINGSDMPDYGKPVDLSYPIQQYAKDVFSIILTSIENYLQSIFGGNKIENKRNDEMPDIFIQADDYMVIIDLNERDEKVEIKINDVILHKKHLVDLNFLESIFGSIDRDLDGNDREAEILNMVSNYIKEEILPDILKLNKEIYYIPASRVGLYQVLSGFGSIVAFLSSKAGGQQFALPSLPVPSSNFYLDVSDIDQSSTNQVIESVYGRIEDEVLQGKVVYNSFHRKLQFSIPELGLLLDLGQVSSMIASLSLITAVLKYVIGRKASGDGGQVMLFIEEPEAHVHPELQVKLMEIFAELPKFGVKVYITSHSDYMLNKLSNMVLAKQVDADKIAVARMYMTPTGSRVNPEEMKIEEYGINDDNFGEVVNQLYDERMRLYEEHNAQVNAANRANKD